LIIACVEDVKDLRVGHALDDFMEGVEQEEILVLRDSTILDNEKEGDELVSLAVAEREKVRENTDNKNRSRAYRAMAEQGDDGGLLSQYDDDQKEVVTACFYLNYILRIQIIIGPNSYINYITIHLINVLLNPKLFLT
jgi:hypothetical protein